MNESECRRHARDFMPGAHDVGYFGRLVIEKLDSRMDR
jgi:hypothetical protein